MSYFATPYTIHFDDTMAYGSHHFLTAFKFQCAARESLLYGDRIFDQPGVPEALDQIHLFTADAYSRNLGPTFLGDRVAILITLEEWGRVSARFCYRVVGEQGQPICAGFQTMICSEAASGNPIPLPEPLREAFDALREITEGEAAESFRQRVLAGTDSTRQLFTEDVRQSAQEYLSTRYPYPRVIAPTTSDPATVACHEATPPTRSPSELPKELLHTEPLDEAHPEVWVFPGQGSFDAGLLSDRLERCTRISCGLQPQLEESAKTTARLIGGDAAAIFSGSPERCRQAVSATPGLSQVSIFVQSVLGAQIRQQRTRPALLMGHSFGEIAALSVAGCCDLPTGVRIVCERVRAIAEFGPPHGALLVVATNRQMATEEIAVLGLPQVVVAGRNHERQTVTSGPREQLDQLRTHLKSQGIEAIHIASPTCFHHPMLRAAAAAWWRQLREIPLQPLSSTVYSPIGRRFISADDDIPTVLSSQFLRPFDLQGSVDDLIAGGFTKFVDCGSAGSLARLLKGICPESIEVEGVDEPHSTVSRQTNGSVAQRGTTNGYEMANVTKATTAAGARGASPGPRQPPIAIVARGCLLPGRATSPAELHAAILQGRPGIFDQRQRDPNWERDFYAPSLVPDKSTSPLAGLVDDQDIVPPDGIDPDVFAEFSRAQQLLCVALAPCVAILRQSARVTCLLGTTADGFQDQDHLAALRYAGIDLAHPQHLERIGGQRSVFQDPYAAVREVFDRIVRPGLDVTLVDAACASSLYAVALGLHALESNDADVVLAGGVFCPGPGNNCLFSQFGGLTATGCRAFDADADGVVFSEGAAVVVLQRLADARQSGQQVAAVIRGVGLSSDGRSPSANVPQVAGQLLALQRCYANYGVDPASIVAIEGHGTSTPVGDATELNTLREFYADHAHTPIHLHSLKGLLGHTGWAAGTASVIAASEVLRTGVFPAQAFHRQPAQELVNAQDVLTVPTQPVQLGPQARIAIDGFGFGGANAHLVIEPLIEGQTIADTDGPQSTESLPSADDSLVVVAWHQLQPTSDGGGERGHRRFEREQIALPTGVVLLPDLADDMDVTQLLSLSVVGATLSQIPSFDDAMRRETGIVLALGGKTARAVEATTRVLAPRLSRNLAGLPAARSIEEAASRARPSGPYTLQCMMPNVSAGQAALRFNLNGPNFVVDAGTDSLEAAFRSAGMLLRSGDNSGTKLVVVAAINANPWPVPKSDPAQSKNEFAAAFAVTTRRHAQVSQLDVICPLETLLSHPHADFSGLPTTEEKLAVCVQSLTALTNPAPQIQLKKRHHEFPLHAPVWIEAPIPPQPTRQQHQQLEKWLVLVEAKHETIDELLASLPDWCQRHMLVVVGEASDQLTARIASHDLFAVDLSDASSTESALVTIREFAPDLVIALNDDRSWDFTEVLDHVSRNDLCEMLFLTMKQLVVELRSHETEIWAVFPDAWRGVIHPLTGAVSGLVKSAKREMPDACLGVLSHRSDSISDALLALQCERTMAGNTEQEVVYDGKKRLVRRLRVVEPEWLPSSPTSRVPLDANSVVVASGGARGVTAVLAESLLRDYGCTVVALGRSVLEQESVSFASAQAEQDYYTKFIAHNPHASPLEMKKSYESAFARWEAKQTIDKLAGLAGIVRYLTVDVTNRDQVDQAIANIAEEFGHIDLIVHGAGVQWSKKLEDRSLTEFRKTFDVKVNGLKNLVASCRTCLGRTVPVHILTSAYSIFGNDGQHDYGAANETLDRLCSLTKVSPEEHWTSIAWSAWDGIGMTRGSEYRALAEKRNLALLDTHAGQRVFKAVMEGKTDSEVNVPLSDSERMRYHVRTIPPSLTEAPRRTFEFPIHLEDVDCLSFHKARGVATLPGAWIVDYMVRATLAITDQPAKYVTIENMRFLRMVRIAHQYDPTMRVIVDAAPTGYHAWLIGDVIHPSGVTLSSDVVFAQATLSTEQRPSPWVPALNGLLRNGHGTVRTVNDPYCAGEQNVQLSGPFDCLPNIEIGPLGRRAIFSPHKATDWGGTIPALLLDAALRVAGMHVVPDALHVPTKMDRVLLPTGMSTDSSAASGWQIRTCTPCVQGDDISCDRVEVTDHNGELQLSVEGAFVTQLR